MWWCGDGARRRSAEDGKGRRRRTATYAGARDEDRSAGAGAGTREQGRKCRHGGGHEGTGAEAPARRRTRESRARTEVLVRRRARAEAEVSGVTDIFITIFLSSHNHPNTSVAIIPVLCRAMLWTYTSTVSTSFWSVSQRTCHRNTWYKYYKHGLHDRHRGDKRRQGLFVCPSCSPLNVGECPSALCAPPDNSNSPMLHLFQPGQGGTGRRAGPPVKHVFAGALTWTSLGQFKKTDWGVFNMRSEISSIFNGLNRNGGEG